MLLFHGHGRPYVANMDGPSATGEQQRLQKLLAQNRRALRAEQQRLRRGIAQKQNLGLGKQGQQAVHAVHNLTASVDLATGLAQRLTSCHDPGSSGYPTAATVRDFLTNSGPVAMAPNARAVVAAKRYCAESAVAVQTKILNYRHGVAPPATWAYETFSDLMASGAREVPKQKTARQWARRWRARWGVARKTLPAHEDLSQEAVQEKAWF